ncbi:hypothetical protein [Streptomyces roseochromogenus]|uniref:Uncharacterized protein n=1 Tax=Streptomyces roseochromogenus subsp. oscitans DS 12.976 TaxID=1352936 RepID=V6KQT9_STRRC|nr:hypothetical protein [Streptomyces roseochromogenus]EST31354.1 hypothetical protein M878_16905 [Streptomyces roseochromogenus subsp. oscitans DS 12.976]
MPRPAGPERRREATDAVIEQLARTGIGSFPLRTPAEGLGRSAGRAAARGAARHHRPADRAVPVSEVVRSAWHRDLSPGELDMTRLIRETEGLAAAGRLTLPHPGLVRGRAESVAPRLVHRGLSGAAALTCATLLNTAFSSLQADLLITGGHERGEAASDALCAWVDAQVTAAA